MPRRQFWIIVAVIAGIGLLVLNWPDGEDDPEPGGGAPAAQQPSAPAGSPAAPAPGGATADQPAPGPGSTPTASPAPAAEPPHAPSGVTEEEPLDPAAAAGAIAAAEQFAEVWATPDPRWHDRVTALTTPALAEALVDAVPPDVPRRITGDGEVYFDAPEWARIGVPTAGGTVVVDVVVVDGKWLVSAVDWWPE
ncbi:MAG TPA: hypothetical protein VIL37_02910 [Natronosporangium sp.]